jgi:hypothetical protein
MFLLRGEFPGWSGDPETKVTDMRMQDDIAADWASSARFDFEKFVTRLEDTDRRKSFQWRRRRGKFLRPTL